MAYSFLQAPEHFVQFFITQGVKDARHSPTFRLYSLVRRHVHALASVLSL